MGKSIQWVILMLVALALVLSYVFLVLEVTGVREWGGAGTGGGADQWDESAPRN